MHTDYVSDALKLTPTAVVTVTSVAGFQWSDISYLLASVYTALLIVQFVCVRIVKPWLESRASKP
jgi:hypothetical protein